MGWELPGFVDLGNASLRCFQLFAHGPQGLLILINMIIIMTTIIAINLMFTVIIITRVLL